MTAKGQATVTSHNRAFLACHGINVRPSGCFPYDHAIPCASFIIGIEAKARAIRLFKAWCLANLPGMRIVTTATTPTIIIRSTSANRPNNVVSNVRPSAIRFQWNSVCRWRSMSDARRCAVWFDPRSRSQALESWKFDHLQRLSPLPFTMGLANEGTIPKGYWGRIFYFCPRFCVTWLWTWHGPSVARSRPSVPYGAKLLLLLTA